MYLLLYAVPRRAAEISQLAPSELSGAAALGLWSRTDIWTVRIHAVRVMCSNGGRLGLATTTPAAAATTFTMTSCAVCSCSISSFGFMRRLLYSLTFHDSSTTTTTACTSRTRTRACTSCARTRACAWRAVWLDIDEVFCSNPALRLRSRSGCRVPLSDLVPDKKVGRFRYYYNFR